MKEIELTQEKIVLIDNGDFELISKYKWYAYKNNSGIFYARHKLIYMHRFIVENYLRRKLKAFECIDHIDRDGLNNQKLNLRICTKQQNGMNCKSHKNSSSKFKGVSWNKNANKWGASIILNGKKIHLGYFIDENHAAIVYNKAAIKYFREFARLNKT